MDDFSNEGLYRLLEKMDREHGEELREIRKQTTATNGRVTAIETKIDGHAREIGRLNSAVFPKKAIVDTVPAQDNPSITLSLSPKMWALIAGIGSLFGMVVPTLIKFAEKLLGLPQ